MMPNRPADRPARAPRRWLPPLLLSVVVGVLAAGAWAGTGFSRDTAMAVPAPGLDEPRQPQSGKETVVLAGGCFWGVQAVFQHVNGVLEAVSGYSGGSKDAAEYETVSTGTTGHAESVQVTFDPSVVSFGQILQIYFSVAHDPTELNRQGPDEGTQYRSAIFAESPEQKRIAAAYIEQLDRAHVFPHPIATQLVDFKAFYPAEGYHQNYATIHPDSPYIAFNDLPKVDNLKRLFPGEYRSAPVLVSVARPQG
jgi:peptide-methionine (S)-S-oxide reductase